MKKFIEWWKIYGDLMESLAWIVLAIPTILWWKEAILWVAIMSLYANYKTANGAYKAGKAKRAAEQSNETSEDVDNDVEDLKSE